jgi:hypothetical protein
LLKWFRIDSKTRSCEYRNSILCSKRGGEHLEQLIDHQFLNRGSALRDNIKVQVAAAAATTIIKILTPFSIYLLIGINGHRPDS